MSKNAWILARIDRESVTGILSVERSACRIECKRDFPLGENGSVVIAQRRHQHPVREIRVGRLPVDVEEIRVDRCLSVFQHVQPPRVVAPHDSHVVRHHVYDLAHPMLMQAGHESVEFFARADLRVQRLVIDDVVAVFAPGSRAQVRRAVDVADTKVCQIGYDSDGIPEAEAGMKLQPVGGARNAQSGCARRRLARRAPVRLIQFAGFSFNHIE